MSIFCLRSMLLRSKSLALIAGLCALLGSPICVWGLDFQPPVRFETFLSGDVRVNGKYQTVGAPTEVFQDQYGFIWFAGESGLARFDGHNYVFYKSSGRKGDIDSSYINDMAMDRSGVVWFATSVGLSRYNAKLDNFTNFRIVSSAGNMSQGKKTGVFMSSVYCLDDKIYIGTEHGLRIFNPKTETFESPFGTMYPTLHSGNLRDIVIHQRELWAAVRGGGLVSIHLDSKIYRQWVHDQGNSRSLLTDNIEKVVVSKEGSVWVSTLGFGVSRLSEDRDYFYHYQNTYDSQRRLSGNHVRDIFIDDSSNVWAAVDSLEDGGLNLYKPHLDRFVRYHHDKDDDLSIPSNQVRAIYEDRNRNIWVGMFPSGFGMFDPSKNRFLRYKNNPSDPTSLSGSGITAIHEDELGQVWVGTEKGLNLFHPDKRGFTRFVHEPGNPKALRHNAVVSIEHYDGLLWVGTWSGGLHSFDRTTQEFYHYGNSDSVPFQYPSPYAWAIENDHRGNLWVGATDGGLSRFNQQKQLFKTYYHDEKNKASLAYNHIWDLLYDSQGNLWVATLKGLDRYDYETDTFLHYYHLISDEGTGLGSNIRVLFEDSEGDIWIGTVGHGIIRYHRDTQVFEHIAQNSSIASSTICSIIEDADGTMWFGSINGIIRYQKESKDLHVYRKEDGIAGNNHNRNAVYIDENGYLYFGSTEGLTVFHPDNLLDQTSGSRVQLTSFKIFNEEVRPGESEILKSSIFMADELTLSYKDSVMTIAFSLMNYQSPHLNEYSYMLEGFDEGWINIGRNNEAIYTNLDSGSYVFRVRGRVGRGEWSPEATEMFIHVSPPPWRSWWAYTLYVFVFVLFLWTVLQSVMRKYRLDSEVKLNQHLKYLDKEKDRYLANISHEIRQPVSGMVLISDYLGNKSSNTLDKKDKEMLHSMSVSGRRLIYLINDILDLYKTKSHGRLQYHFKPLKLSKIIEQVYTLMKPVAQQKGLLLINDVNMPDVKVYGDEEKISQILCNLISNAIKYTDVGFVRVDCQLVESEHVVYVLIKDSGVGIASDDIHNVFNEMFQVDDRRGSGGTGLGLFITKKLVESLGGTISVSSDVSKDSHGTTFKVSFPLSAEEESEGEVESVRRQPIIVKNKKILVVDDAASQRHILKKALSAADHVVTSVSNGIEGIELLKEQYFDMVITDYQMPIMTGPEFCQSIRQLYTQEELPVIFVTSHTVNQDFLTEIIRIGANGAFQKPIDINTINVDLSPYWLTDNLKHEEVGVF